MSKRSRIVAAKDGTYRVLNRSKKVIAVCSTFEEAWVVQGEYLGYLRSGETGMVLTPSGAMIGG